mgnify:CR=1 FL=1|jgi:hypothetical protein
MKNEEIEKLNESIVELKEAYDSKIDFLEKELENLKSQFSELEDYVVNSINARLTRLE